IRGSRVRVSLGSPIIKDLKAIHVRSGELSLALGPPVKGRPLAAVDRQLGLAFGAGAAHALNENQSGAMVAFQPPELKFAPLAEWLNKVRTAPARFVLQPKMA
ncbi:MAG: hypothetical protein WA579_10405, partial [Rhodomicrobium sp.]